MKPDRVIIVILLLCGLCTGMISAEEKKTAEELAIESATADLESGNWYLIGNALMFLADKDVKKADEIVERSIESSPPYLQMAACEYCRIKKLSVNLSKIVTAALNSSHRPVVDIAGRALASIDAKKSTELLMEAWNDRTDKAGENVSRMLVNFKDNKPTEMISRILKTSNQRMITYAVQAAAALEIKELEREILAIKPTTDEQQQAINEYCSAIKDSAAAVKYLVKQLDNRDPGIAIRSGSLIANLKFDTDFDNFQKKIAKRSTSSDAVAALRAFELRAKYEDSRIIAKLINGPSDYEKLVGCALYERFPDKTLLPAIRKILKDKNPQMVRMAALKAICTDSESRENVEAVRSLLMSAKEEDAYLGCYGAMYMGKKDFVPLFEKVLSSEISARTAAAVGLALDNLDPEAGMVMCEKMLGAHKARPVIPPAIALRYMPYAKSVELLIASMPQGNPDTDAAASDFDKAVRESLAFLTGYYYTPTEPEWKNWWAEAGKTLPDASKKTLMTAPFTMWKPVNNTVFANQAKRVQISGEVEKERTGEQAVEMALIWLANFQDLDGKWNSPLYKRQAVDPNDVASGTGEDFNQGVTGLALMAFMSAGYKPQGGLYSRTIKAGLDYLAGYINPDGSLFQKSYAQTDHMQATFEHATAATALCYAVILGAEEYRPIAQRMICFLCQSQSAKGAWGKNPTSSELLNTNTTTEVVEAILAAKAAGLFIPAGTMEGIWSWYSSGASDSLKAFQKKRTEKMTQEELDKLTTETAYTGWTGPEFIAVNTAQGAYVFRALGLDRDTPQVLCRLNNVAKYKPDDWLSGSSPEGGAKTFPHAFLLYVTRAKHIRGGTEWKTYYGELLKFIASKMDKKGAAYGSYLPEGNDGRHGGRILATAFAALSLESAYFLDYNAMKPVVYKAAPKIEEPPKAEPDKDKK